MPGRDREDRRAGAAQRRAARRDRRQREPAAEHARGRSRRSRCAARCTSSRQRRDARRRDRRAVTPQPPAARSRASCATSRSTSTSRSAPTNSTTRPWMISVRLPASCGSKTLGSSWRLEVPTVSAPKRSAAKKTPTGAVAAEQGDRDPEEADVRDEDVRASRCGTASRGCRSPPARPANAPGDRHREEVVALDVDAAVARRLRVEADRAHLEAERRAVQDRPEDDERAERDEEADVEPLQHRVAPEDGQVHVVDDVVRDRVEAAGADERPLEAEEVRADPDRDPVEHDRRDHLVGPGRRFQEAGDPAPDRARRRSRATMQRTMCAGPGMPPTTSRRSRRRRSRRSTGPGRRC